MKALIVVDLQNDFMPWGALPVPEGDEVIPVANRLIGGFDVTVASQDWHPADHGSFAANHAGRNPGDAIQLNGLRQILWPVHCVQDTNGAAFVDAFDADKLDRVFRKATDAGIDSYSAFFDNGHLRSTGLQAYLEERNVNQVYLVGVATDYCVKYTALDARELGLETYVIEDGCRGVELNPGDVERALDEMQTAGTHLIRSKDL